MKTSDAAIEIKRLIANNETDKAIALLDTLSALAQFALLCTDKYLTIEEVVEIDTFEE